MSKTLVTQSFLSNDLIENVPIRQIIQDLIDTGIVNLIVYSMEEEYILRQKEQADGVFSGQKSDLGFDINELTIHRNPMIGFYSKYTLDKQPVVKISDPEEKACGVLVVNDEKAIYNPFIPEFFHERDSFVYGYANTVLYTTESFEEIVKSYTCDKKCYIDAECQNRKGLINTKPLVSNKISELKPDELYTVIVNQLSMNPTDVVDITGRVKEEGKTGGARRKKIKD